MINLWLLESAKIILWLLESAKICIVIQAGHTEPRLGPAWVRFLRFLTLDTTHWGQLDYWRIPKIIPMVCLEVLKLGSGSRSLFQEGDLVSRSTLLVRIGFLSWYQIRFCPQSGANPMTLGDSTHIGGKSFVLWLFHTFSTMCFSLHSLSSSSLILSFAHSNLIKTQI